MCGIQLRLQLSHGLSAIVPRLFRFSALSFMMQIILMAGLQGVGKTTACGKLALALKNENRKVLLVATDVYRPAAIDQLQMLGKRAGVEVFDMGSDAKPVEIAANGLEKARKEDFDTVIVDTAGRLQVSRRTSKTSFQLCYRDACALARSWDGVYNNAALCFGSKCLIGPALVSSPAYTFPTRAKSRLAPPKAMSCIAD